MMYRSLRGLLYGSVWALMLLGSATQASAKNPAPRCIKAGGLSEVLACYKEEQAALPLRYQRLEQEQLPGVQKRRFALISQHWSPQGLVKPASWRHTVDIYIPDDALRGRAVLAVNNGINHASDSMGVKTASDIDPDMALAIAQQTRSIVVSVSDVPNQFLTYSDDGVARREDDSIAHSWKLFLDHPHKRSFMPLHVPMMEAVVKAMDLAQQELAPWHIQHFIATGASKRAWTVWLAVIADTRIDAMVPFVFDFLNTEQALAHTYQVYGQNWPIAFGPYQREGITTRLETPQFHQLMQIEDPFRYLTHSRHAMRLAIPKYIVNASSDDFFVPDNARFYFDRLPGAKTLRVAPNASHGGIKEVMQASLITAVNRWQQRRTLPEITTQSTQAGETLTFSEKPVKLTQWVATNLQARDFRYPCGTRYVPTEITPAESVQLPTTVPDTGWRAQFVEATFADGFVASSPVVITPDTYPSAAPPSLPPACLTIPSAPALEN